METIFESMAEGVAVFDAAGQVVRLNRAGAALAGISSAPLLALPPTALGTGISAGLAGRNVALAGHPLVLRALAGEVVTGEEVNLTREDGAQVSLRVSVAPLFGDEGQVTGAVAILEDVTEQRQHQREQLAVGWVAAALNHPLDLKETLDTAVEALTAALGADHSAILLADGEQKMLRVASARGYIQDVTGEFALLPIEAPLAPCLAFRTRKVQISQDIPTSAHHAPLSRLLGQPDIQASLAAPLLVEDQTLGVLLYSYAQPHQFSIDEQQVARAIADQIALAVVNARLYEEVADYAAWQENERRILQAVIDALPAGVTLRDKAGKLFMYNQAALHLAINCAEVEEARLERQAPVEPVWQLVGPGSEPDERVELPSQLAVETGEPVRAQLSLRQGDGRVVPVLVNAAPVRDADGNLTRGVAVFQDITALKELERHKDEFISVASHELRGPLTVIRGQAQLLLRQLRRQEKQGELPPDMLHIMESVESIESQTARLNDLVSDLLDVSRIQSGKLTLQRGPVELMALVSKVVQHWKPASASHTLILEAVPTEEVVGRWDVKRVEQILNNLLGNAVKYSPEGGRVTVRVQVDRHNKQVLLEVQDEGMGIPPEASSHLFERFYRAGNVSNISGTGLGLYISRQLATAHGGDLWATSPGLEQGSTFSLRLPLQ
jgi:two-component system phosphate regulon sensor histidine kinase PhoR